MEIPAWIYPGASHTLWHQCHKLRDLSWIKKSSTGELQLGGEMRYINLGKTDIKVSVIGFGAWAIGGWMWGGTDHQQSVRAVEAAIDAGINLIDTAPAYGQGLSEQIVGQAIKGKRDQVIIATKCGLVWNVERGEHFFDYQSGQQVYKYLGPESIRYEIDLSLKRLGIDHIDFYQASLLPDCW